MEKHLRRFVWRYDGEARWRVFAIDRMHFGDRPAAIGLEVAKRLFTEYGRDIDPAAVEMIKKDYMDDGFGHGLDQDVCSLMGEVMLEDGSLEYRGTVAQIMERGSFFIKYMICDREARPDVLKNFSGSVLGMLWDTVKDVISMRPMINLSRKIQKIGEGPAEARGCGADRPGCADVKEHYQSGVWVL